MKKYQVLIWLATTICVFAENLPDISSRPLSGEERVEDWFKDAKMGFFLCYGLYSLPEGVCKNGEQIDSHYAEWYQVHSRGKGESFADYHALIKEFRGEKFDADKIVRSAKNAGYKYIIFTAKFHDGFAMWPTQHNGERTSTDPNWVYNYNITETPLYKNGNQSFGGPYGPNCDPIRKIKDACDVYGMKLVFYYSHVKDWHHPDAYVGKQQSDANFFPADLQNIPDDKVKYWDKVAIPQIIELCENYQPDGFWFDTPSQANSTDENVYIPKMINEIHTRLPKCVINGRVGVSSLEDYPTSGDSGSGHSVSGKYGDAPLSAFSKATWGFHSERGYSSEKNLFVTAFKLASSNTNSTLAYGLRKDGSFKEEDIIDRNGNLVSGNTAIEHFESFGLNLFGQWPDNPEAVSEGAPVAEAFHGTRPVPGRYVSLRTFMTSGGTKINKLYLTCKDNKIYAFYDPKNINAEDGYINWVNHLENPLVSARDLKNPNTPFTYSIDGNGQIHFSISGETSRYEVKVFEFAHDILPKAVADEYELDTNTGTSLTVNAQNGVLQNDSSYTGLNPVAAHKTGNPLYGDVTFNSDGSFTYTLKSEYTVNGSAISELSGKYDEFTYRATVPDSDTGNVYDGGCYSRLVTVKINFSEPLAPEISTEGNGIEIVDGDASPVIDDHSSFGTIINGQTISRTFTVKNTGTADLTVSQVSLSGSSAFTVTSQPAATVSPGGSTTFTVRFSPATAGNHSASLSFTNNDADENPYNFSISGDADPLTYSVNFQTDGTAGSGITGDTAQTVVEGENAATVTATAPLGYHFVNWTLSGSVYSSANPLTVNNVSSNLSLTANFEINTYTVTFNAGSNGVIEGNAVQTVEHGSAAVAPLVTANSGWEFSGWDTAFSNITGNLTVTAQYSEVTGGELPVANLLYNADSDSDGNNVWEDSLNGVRNWSLDSGVVRQSVVSGYNLTHAYTFNGNGGEMASIDDFDSAATRASASFEFWVRPTELSGEHILFETGATSYGLSVTVSSGEIQLAVIDIGASESLSNVIAQKSISTEEFSHIVAVVDYQSNQLSIYINGQLAAQAVNYSSDWAGGNNSGLGRTESKVNRSGLSPFTGEMHMFSFYKKALSSSEVSQLFLSKVNLPDVVLDFDAETDSDGNSTWENTAGVSGFDWSLGSIVRETVSSSSSKITKAYAFNGTQQATMKSWQYLSPDPTENSASFELWLKPGNVTGRHMIFETGGNGNGVSVVLEATGISFIVQTDSDANETALQSAPISTSEFSHIVGVYDKDSDGNGTPDLRLYINGELVDSRVDISALTDWAGNNGSSLSGGSANTSYNEKFQGHIHALRFYSKALSELEVQQLYLKKQ